jgi:hypothetical protein
VGAQGQRVSGKSEGGLWLYLRGGGRVLALPADQVERALLTDEVAAPRWPPALGPALAPRGCVGLVGVRGVDYGAWDLGTLLGTPEAERAWILLRLARPEGVAAVALRTDECLHVGALASERRLPLPPGILHGRAPFRTAFPLPESAGARGDGSLVGLELDLARLWTDYELEFTGELLRQAAAAMEAGHVGS